MAQQQFPLADLALSRRLERAEGRSNARFVDSHARLRPASGACWIEVAGALAMFDGPASPATQTFALGISQLPADEDLDRIEAFFVERGAPVYHEVSPLADEKLVPMLTARGYRPFEFTSVMYRPIDLTGLEPRTAGGPGARPTVHLIEKGEEDVFARTSAAGWSHAGIGDFILEMARINLASDGVSLFLAELDGQPIATAALSIVDGIAHLAGASTIPDARNRGAQLALLDHRLRHAAAHGCDVALMGALPGSGSQRNAERNGFRIAYTRIKWQR
jgi:ribosomal protein S18 acetylase RimI-like enzyme